MAALLSIVVPNFNYASYLRPCLDSALALDYAHKEIIVVDDGSTDGSHDILREYEQDGKITAIYKANGGQPDAVNVGFSRSRGEFVYVLDADDTVFPQMFKHVLSAWTPQTSKIQFPLEAIDQTGTPLGNAFPNYHTHRSPEELRESVLLTGEYQSPPTSGNVYARSYLERILPIDKTRFRFSDGPLNAVAPLYGDVYSISAPLGQYRMHTRNQWGRATWNPKLYTTAVRHNLQLDAYVIEHSRRLNLPVDPAIADRAPWALQYRMASVCANPDEHPLEETPAHVAKLGIAAVHSATSLSTGQKTAMAAWFTLMAAAPSRAREELIKLRFLPSYRPAALGKTLRMIGALRPSTR